MSPTTKDQILDVAERLFAEQGVAATSLRSVMAAAGVNPAAVHYHFGGKAGLVEAIIARRIEPLNAERMRRFDALEAAAGGRRRPALRAVVEAYVAPALRLGVAGGGGASRFVRLLGRFHQEGGEPAAALLRRHFQPVVERFTGLLGRCLPNADRVAIAWRVHFLIGAMAHTMACREHLAWLSPDAAGGDAEVAIDELVAFAVGALQAPPKRRAPAAGAARGGKP